MYAIKKRTSRGGYESFDTHHHGELLPINEDNEKLIFWEKERINKKKKEIKGDESKQSKDEDRDRNENKDQYNEKKSEIFLQNINMFVTITCTEKKNFLKITKKHYEASVTINTENLTELLNFDSQTARKITATGPVCVSKKGAIKDIKVSFPLVGISLFIRINHYIHMNYFKNKFNAKAMVLIYPIKSKFLGEPTSHVFMIGYSDIAPIHKGKK